MSRRSPYSQAYNKLEEQQGGRQYSTRCSLTILSFQNTEGTRPV
jgi:hypothetical protein